MRFDQKVVLITGGASGIGKGAVEAFVREGAKVMISDVQAEAGEALAAALTAQGGEVAFFAADVADPQAVKALFKATKAQFGRLDIAINNAGMGIEPRPTGLLSQEDWHRVLDVNLHGVFYGTQEALHLMEPQGSGIIVNVASMAGLRALPFQSAYTASKHAVIGLTKAAAIEYAQKGIRVDALCPTFTITPMVEQMFEYRPELERKLLPTIPMGRFGQVEDVVNALFFLCDPAAAFITGQALPVDGGSYAW